MIAVVTGASSGIGEAAARRIAREPGAKLVLVARRQDRLDALAAEIGDAVVVAVDLLDEGAPARIADAVQQEHGRLDLLVNNAGSAWRGTFFDHGYEGVRRHMALNFDATLRVTEALLPILRASAPSSIVNVASVAGRVARATAGGYGASKFALIGWSEALAQEEAAHGVHVGAVLPGFVATEGFPQRELVASRRTRWIVSTPEKVAEAILQAGPGGKHERYIPRPYGMLPVVRSLAPGLIRRFAGGAAPATKND